MKKLVERELIEILSDKTSGSEDLLSLLNKFFIKNFSEVDDPLSLIQDLKIQFKSFQKIQDYLCRMSKAIAGGHMSLIFFELYETDTINNYDRIIKKAFPFLKNKIRILTISNSRTVFEILKRLRSTNNRLNVIVSESRPKFEGRILAKKLLKEKIEVKLITEAMLAKYVQCCDCVLIGTDAVLKDNNVVNKVGSLQLAILCKHYDKPFYVVASKSKFSAKKYFQQHEEDTNEIWRNAPKKISINNLYFEIFPKRLITKLITE